MIEFIDINRHDKSIKKNIFKNIKKVVNKNNFILGNCVEIHTGKISNLVKLKKNFHNELERIKKSSILAKKLEIEVHAGHGLDYKTTKILNKIKEIEEFNIGHYIIGESIFFGLSKVIKNFKRIIRK